MLKVRDLGVEQADLRDGSAYDRFQHLGRDRGGRDRSGSQTRDQLGRGLAAPVTVPTAELTHPALAEKRGRLRSRVIGQERQRHLGCQLLKHHRSARPVFGEDGPQLVRRCRARFDQRHPSPHQGCELARGRSDRLDPSKAVIVGPGVVGEHERVGGIGLRAG